MDNVQIMLGNQFFVSFANQVGSTGLSLLHLSGDGRSARWVDLSPVRRGVGAHFNGVCGVCAWEGYLAFCTQSVPAYIAIYDASGQTLLQLERLEGVSDSHGLVKAGNRLLVASTGTNQLFALGLSHNRVVSCEPVWEYPSVSTNNDAVHLNGLTASEEGIFITAFGPRDEEGRWTSGKGVLQLIGHDRVIDSDLMHPHSPVYFGGRLYVCESGRGRVIIYRNNRKGRWVRERVAETRGYPRGLLVDGEGFWVGISGQRSFSRSRRQRNVTDDAAPSSALLRFEGQGESSIRRIELKPFGREVYEVVGGAPKPRNSGLLEPVISRNQVLQESVEAMSEQLVRTNQLIKGIQQQRGVPLVTIITPAYNRAGFLRETIDSILDQEFPGLEYLVLDDGSTDETPRVLAEYGSRIKSLRHDNMGENLTVNRGLELAQGEIICVVNSDDPMLPGSIARAVGVLSENPEALIAYPDWVEIDAHGETVTTLCLPNYDLDTMVLGFNVSMGPGVFIRRKALELIGARNAALKYTGDLDFWFRLALKGKFAHIPEPLATHRTHPEAASSAAKGSRMAREVIQLVDTVFASAYLPGRLRRRRHRIYSVAHRHAVAYCGKARAAAIGHCVVGVYHAVLSHEREGITPWVPNRLLRARIHGKKWISGVRIRAKRLMENAEGPAGGAIGPIGLFKGIFRNIAKRAALVGLVAGGASLRWAWRLSHMFSRETVKLDPPLFALVSHILPPMWSGQAMVIDRLLEGFSPPEYVLISHPSGPTDSQGSATPARVVLPREPFETGWLRGDLMGSLSVALRVLIRGWRIANEVRRSGARVLITTTGDIIDPAASAIASAITRVPLVFYEFDDYLSQWGFQPGMRKTAAVLERIVLAKAAEVVVPNEALAGDLMRRRGVDAKIIRNPAFQVPDVLPSRNEQSAKVRIVYTGAIYHVNYGAFRTLIQALSEIHDRSIELDIFTAQNASQLKKEEIFGDFVRVHAHVSPAEAVEIQRSADMLFLGFSFDSSVPEVIATSAPGKLGDYLASGRPILALVPPDTFMSDLLSKHACAIVVDADEPAQLMTAILRLLDDPSLVEGMTQNALELARELYNPRIASQSLRALVEALL